MIRHVAFLRGINVSGQKLIRMEDLIQIFASMKFKNIKTYIQSGNVIFDSTEKNTDVLTKKIEFGLNKSLGYKVTVLLRTMPELEEMVMSNPFKKIKTDENVKPYVTFLSEAPKIKHEPPFQSKQKDVEVFEIKNRDVFCLGLPLSNGRFGFPNAFIEKEFGVLATTRNRTTINKIIWK